MTEEEVCISCIFYLHKETAPNTVTFLSVEDSPSYVRFTYKNYNLERRFRVFHGFLRVAEEF